MSARKLAMRTFRGLQLGFIALVTAHICLGWGYPWWWTPAAGPGLRPDHRGQPVGRRRPDHPRVAREQVEVGPPVTGGWSALNSPADRTPSHGVHAYGQTYAIDIVAEPEPGARPAFSPLWPFAGAPQTSPRSTSRCGRSPTPRSSGSRTGSAITSAAPRCPGWCT
ncbi:hypothetical protein SHIRM173S_08164 [Streptomyces hirsutus]